MKRKKGSAKHENGERTQEEEGKLRRGRKQCEGCGGYPVGMRGKEWGRRQKAGEGLG